MADMEDEYTLAVGLERTPGHVRRGGWSNLPMRLGASFRRWAYRVGRRARSTKDRQPGHGISLSGRTWASWIWPFPTV